MASTVARSLFRSEALDHADATGYGRLINARPVGFTVVVVGVLVSFLLLTAYVLSFSYTRKSTAEGILMPVGGISLAVADGTGTIRSLEVGEGGVVKKGDVLAVIAAERKGERAEDATRAIEALLSARKEGADADLASQQAQATRRIEYAQSRLAALAQERHQIARQVSIEEQRVALAEQAVERARALEASQFLSAAAVQERSAGLLDARGRLAELQRLDTSKSQEEIQLRAEVADLGFRKTREREQAAGAVKALEQELEEHRIGRVWSIVAERAGRVAGITVRAGDAVQAGRVLLNIVPERAPLEAIAYVGAADIAFVRERMDVALTWAVIGADSERRLTGKVSEISAVPMRRSDIAELAGNGGSASSDERLYRIRVALNGDAAKPGLSGSLRPGMAVTAQLHLERHRLITWLLSPLARLGRPLT